MADEVPTPEAEEGRWSLMEEDAFRVAALKAFRQDKKDTKEWRDNAKEDYSFDAGDQWADEDVSKLNEQQRPVVTFNRVSPIIDAVSGAESSNPQAVQYLPRTINQQDNQQNGQQVDDAGVSEMFTETARWVEDENDAEFEDSLAFRDAAVCGMGWVELWIDYEQDPDGRIMNDRISPLEMYWDATATKQNVADARRLARLRMMPDSEIAEFWPDKEIAFAHEQTDEVLIDDDTDTGELFQKFIDHTPVLQIQWWEREPMARFVNPKTGKRDMMPMADFGQINEQLTEKGFGALRGVRQDRRKYFQAFIVGNTVMERGELHPSEKSIIPGFTFQCITGKLDERNGTFIGLMSQMKDPQRWANKFLSQTMHIMNAGAKGGLLAEKSAFLNPKKAENDWANPEAIIWLAEGALSGTGGSSKPRIQERTPPPMPPAIKDLLAFSIGSIRDVTGINLEFLGTRGAFQPGMVEESRLRQGMLVLAALFNSLRRYRKFKGRVLLHLIQTYIEDGRLIRITGQNRYIQFRRDPGVVRYDVIVDQAPTSPNQKQEIWNGLMQLLPAMMKAGIGIPPDIIDYAPLPQSVINRIKQFFAQQAKGSDERAKVGEAAQQAVIAKDQAQALLDVARAEAATDRAETDKDNAKTDAFEALSKAINDAAKIAADERIAERANSERGGNST